MKEEMQEVVAIAMTVNAFKSLTLFNVKRHQDVT